MTDSEISTLQNLELLFFPFMEIERFFEGQNYVTISLLPVLLHTLRFLINKSLDSLSNNNEVVFSWLVKMKERLEESIGDGNFVVHINGNDNQVIQRNPRRRRVGIPLIVFKAHFLDPRFSNFIGFKELSVRKSAMM